MRLVLASQGFTTEEIANKTAELVGKPLNHVNVAVINEAYVAIDPGRDQKWIIDELSQLSQYIKGAISFVNLRAHDTDELRKRVNFADMIYIVGGKQAILPKLFKETGFDLILKEQSASKVIFGTSAGSNVLGKHIEDKNYWLDQYGSYEKFLEYSSLGLVDFNILPHFERPDHPRRNRETLSPLLKDNPFILYGLTDAQAVFYDNGNISFAGGEPVKFGAQSIQYPL